MQNKVTLSNHIQIWYETFGNKGNQAILLMMGNGCDAMIWPDNFCQSLADLKFYVIRFDQRDTGLSSSIDFNQNPYTLMDMVDDSILLLDKLNIEKANIVGFSTGGLIAELLAIHFPKRVLSLILMMTSIDLTIKNDAFRGMDLSHSKLSSPKKEFIQAILRTNATKPSTLSEKIAQLVENFRLANGPDAFYDEAFFYQLFERSLKRVDGLLKKVGYESNHALATSATRVISEEEFATILAPTLIIAGSEDPIFPPDHAEAILNAIPFAQLRLVEKMGHTLNPIFFEILISSMVSHMSKKVIS